MRFRRPGLLERGPALLWFCFTAALVTLAFLPGGGARPAFGSRPGGSHLDGSRLDGPNGTDLNLSWRPLTWDDFPVNDTQTGLSAETVAFLHFRYKTHVEKTRGDDGTEVYVATITQITFSGGLDKARSWRRSNVGENTKNNADLLRHEQGHLDLNEIKRRQMQALPLSRFPVGRGASMQAATADLSRHLGEWFRGEMFALKTRQIQYDAETNFSMNRKIQQEWNGRIEKDIATIPAFPETLVAGPVPSSTPATYPLTH